MKRYYYLPIFMSFGLALGIAFGQVLLNDISLGMVLGLIVGVVAGIGLDSGEMARKTVVNKKKTKK